MEQQSDLFEKIKRHMLDSATAHNGRVDTEVSLAEQFGVSRYKIRQVLNTLTQIGILERTPRRGSVIKRLEPEDLTGQLKLQFSVAGFDAGEFIEARRVIECSILPLAIRRVTPKLLAQMDNALALIEQHADSPLQADKYDQEFHLLLLQACGNSVLQAFSIVLVTYFEKTKNLLLAEKPEYFFRIAEKQRAILTAIKENNVDHAVSLLHQHLVENASLLDKQ